MNVIVLIRAIFVRLLFGAHGLICIWRLYLVTHDPNACYLTLALIGLFIETVFTIWRNKGQEWQWFCPSVFFFLWVAVPAVVQLEVHEMERRIMYHDKGLNVSEILKLNTSFAEGLSGRIEGLDLEIRIPLKLSSDQWLKSLEQALLLFLIIGRWILPKGKLTHDQLSQLLLVYIGMAADIVEFFDAFKEEEVKYNRALCYSILSIWAWSLLQFTMVLTSTKARKDHSGIITGKPEPKDEGCCTPDVSGIIMSIIMQDGPFLTLRLLLIIHYGVVSYTNFFFTCKNSIVIILLIYRLITIQVERRDERRKPLPSKNSPAESDSNTRLLQIQKEGSLQPGKVSSV